MTTSDTETGRELQNSRTWRKERKALKARVTRALQNAMYPDGYDNPIGHLRRAEKGGRDGFHYSDEAGEHSYYPRDRENTFRAGIIVGYKATKLWGQGKYDEANEVMSASNYYLAFVLTRAGFTVHVEDHGNHMLTIWADENEGV